MNPIPENYPRVSPYLYVKGAADAIGFYGKVFGAAERGGPMVSPDGKVFHAELEIGDSLIMLSDEFEEFGNRSPNTIGGTPVLISVYVENVDDVFNRAIEMGAKEIQPVQDRSTVTGGRGSSRIPSGIGGASPRTSSTFLPRRWASAWPSNTAANPTHQAPVTLAPAPVSN